MVVNLQWTSKSTVNMILGMSGPSSAVMCAQTVFWPSQSYSEVLQASRLAGPECYDLGI